MAQSEQAPWGLLPSGDIDPGSKRLELGLHHHGPVQAWRELTKQPARMSVAVHELTHFHSLTNIVGVVFTARAFFQQFFYEQLMAYADARRTGLEKIAVVYLNTLFQRQRMIELWTPLLEGLAVYAQTSRPCRQLEVISDPAASLLRYGAALSGLDPSQAELRQDATLDALRDSVTSSAGLDAGGLPLAARIELGGAPELLPYFLGHAYVRAIHRRFCQAIPELECPEVFTNFMLRVLRGSARRTLLGRGVRPDQPEAVTRLYDWVDMVKAAPPQLLREIYALPENADAIDALMCKDAENPLIEQWVRVGDAVGYVPALLPGEWGSFTDMLDASSFESRATGTDELADRFGFERVPGETLETLAASMGYEGIAAGIKQALPAYVGSTLMMNVTSGGICRLLGRVAGGSDHCVLDVDGHRWQLRLRDPTARSLGFEPAALPTVEAPAISLGERAPALEGGLELDIASYLEWEAEWPLVVELRVRNASARPFLARIARSPGADRATLEQVDRQFRERHLASQSLREELEIGDDASRCAAVLRHKGFGWLADGLLSNLPRHREAMAGLRDRWVRAILGQLLGRDLAEEVARDLTAHHLSSGMLTLPRVPAAVADAYSAPVKYSGPGADDTLALLELVNRDAEQRYGKRLFALEQDDVLRYVGLWEP